jgi:hypothetical protein
VKDNAASRQARQQAGGRGGKVGRLDPTQNSAGGRPDLGEGAGRAATPPAFTRANQNVATTIALLDALRAPSIDGVGEVYQRLHQAEASILPPANPKDGG